MLTGNSSVENIVDVSVPEKNAPLIVRQRFESDDMTQAPSRASSERISIALPVEIYTKRLSGCPRRFHACVRSGRAAGLRAGAALVRRGVINVAAWETPGSYAIMGRFAGVTFPGSLVGDAAPSSVRASCSA